MGIVNSRYNNESAGNLDASRPASNIGLGNNVVGVSGMRDGLGFGIKTNSLHHHQQQQYSQPSLGSVMSGGGGASLGGPHTRTGSIRSAPRQPMPETGELEKRFTKVLVSHPAIFYFSNKK